MITSTNEKTSPSFNVIIGLADESELDVQNEHSCMSTDALPQNAIDRNV